MTNPVYIYCADIYCESCGAAIRAQLDAEGKRPTDIENESSYDSDDYPKGPHADGGGESDRPQYCAECGEYLFTPLTDIGQEYAIDALWEYVITGGKRGNRAVLDEWADDLDFYSLSDDTKLRAYHLFREEQRSNDD